MKNYKRVALLLCIMLLTGTFAGCGWSKKEKDKSENSTKSSEDKAVDEIKNVFNLMRIQLQKIQEAMGKIRRNALNYSVKDYEEILLENLDTISDTKEKFQKYIFYDRRLSL